MRALVDSDSHAANDGSLHIAARMANPDQVSLLIQRGHDVGWPSERLGGRTPAAELCLAADGSGQKWERAVKQTMRLLFPWPNASRKFEDKTVLHLAIENPKAAVSVLRCVLELTDLRLQPARDEDYLFIDKATRFHYSPTKYVEYLCPNKSEPEKAELIALLKAHDLKDRFFAPIGRPQPRGAEGLPPDIQKEVDEQELASLKYDQQMKREDEMARKKAQISEQTSLQMLRHMESQAQMEMELAREKSDREATDLAKKQSMNLKYQEEAASSQLRNQRLLDNQTLSQKRAMTTAQLDHKRREEELGTHLQIDRETKLHQTRLQNQRLEDEERISHQRAFTDVQLDGKRREEEMTTRFHMDRVNQEQQQRLKGQKSRHRAELEQAEKLATAAIRTLAQSPSNLRFVNPAQRQIERGVTELD